MFKKYVLLKILPIGIVLIFLSMAQFKIYLKNFDKYLETHIEAAKGVVDGYPHWRIYQNRVAGPYAIKLTQMITGFSFQKSYFVMVFIWMLLFYSILVAVSLSIKPSLVFALSTAVAAAFFNSLLMRGLWLYPWDYIDLMIFTMFTWAIIKKKPIGYFICIIIVETFNREVSLILSGWLLFDSFVSIKPNIAARRLPEVVVKCNKNKAIVSILLICFVVFTVEFLRDTLLIKQIGPEFFRDYDGSGGLVMVRFWDNINFIYFSFSNITGLTATYSILILALLALSIAGIFSENKHMIRVSLLYLSLWFFTIIFGVIYETRVWLSYIPFIVIICPMILSSIERRSLVDNNRR